GGYFCGLPDLTIAPDMLTLAEQILHSKTGEFDPASFRDRYEEALPGASEGQAGRCRSRAQEDLCPAAPGGQSDGSTAPQRRRGQQTGRAAHGSCQGPRAQTGVSAIAHRAAMLPLADSRDGTVYLALDPL